MTQVNHAQCADDSAMRTPSRTDRGRDSHHFVERVRRRARWNACRSPCEHSGNRFRRSPLLAVPIRCWQTTAQPGNEDRNHGAALLENRPQPVVLIAVEEQDRVPDVIPHPKGPPRRATFRYSSALIIRGE